MATTKFDKPVGTEIESLNSKITEVNNNILRNILISATSINSTGYTDVNIVEDRTNYVALLLEFGQASAQKRYMAFVTGAKNNSYFSLAYNGNSSITLQDIYNSSNTMMRFSIVSGSASDLTLYHIYGLGKH